MQSCTRTVAGAQKSWNKQSGRDVSPQKQKTPGDTGKQKTDDMTRGVPDRGKLILTDIHGVVKSTIPKNNVLQRMQCFDAANRKDIAKPIVLLNQRKRNPRGR